jgi:acyl carrier protein
VVLDRLPLTAGGKVDRRALPAPGAGERVDPGAAAAPRTATEQRMAALWSEVLGVERVGADEDFYALGGHSLVAVRLSFRISREFGVELPLRALLEAPTVADAAARVDELRGAGREDDAPPPVVSVARTGPLPLTLVQRHLWTVWYARGHHEERGAPEVLRLAGALNPRALRQAVAGVVRRHEILRTVFRVVDGEPAQVVLPSMPPPLLVADLGGLPAAARAREAARLERGGEARPFELECGPLFRGVLVRASREAWTLLYDRQHLVGDGWSSDLLMRELSALYNGFAAGRTPVLPPVSPQYGDWAAWQAAWLTPRRLQAEAAWWRERLRGAAPLALPRGGDGAPGGYAVHRFWLRGELLASLRAMALHERCTLFVLFLAATKALLARLTGQTDVSVVTPVSGRTRPETERLIGLFAHLMVLRTDLSGDPPFHVLLRRVRDTVHESFAHQEVPFLDRLALTAEERAEKRRIGELYRFGFAFHPHEPVPLRLDGVELDRLEHGVDDELKSLEMASFQDCGDRVECRLGYRPECYGPDFGVQVERAVAGLLEHAAADREATLAALRLDDAPAAAVTATPPAEVPDFAF